MDDHDIQHFEDLLEGFDHAMLVSVAKDRSLHARPMAIAESDGAKMCFATGSRSAKAAEVALHPRVSVVMQGGGSYLALLEVDPERAEYWDRTGARRLEFLWEAGKALATGRRIPEDELSGHGKFTFG